MWAELEVGMSAETRVVCIQIQSEKINSEIYMAHHMINLYSEKMGIVKLELFEIGAKTFFFA